MEALKLIASWIFIIIGIIFTVIIIFKIAKNRKSKGRIIILSITLIMFWLIAVTSIYTINNASQRHLIIMVF